MIPVLGGSFEGYADIATYYRQVWSETGRRHEDAKVEIFAHLHVQGLVPPAVMR